MKLTLTPMFTEADVRKITTEFLRQRFEIVKNELFNIGLQFVRDARLKSKSQGGFDDQTGNLRSSIGFMLYYDGQRVEENFEGIDADGGGVIEGRKYAEDISKEFPKGWVLITVAAMDYATYVEAKGYDVITGATLYATEELNRALKRIQKY